MVILSGPRQCGKSTLARALLEAQRGAYYGWDTLADCLAIQKRNLDLDRPLWVLDDLHKHRRWRGLLKELVDAERGRRRILVTGSARLDLYGRGGDSLQGRYLPHHLHPLTYSELSRLPFGSVFDLPKLPNADKGRDLRDLLKLGGFPEPLLGGSEREAARWRLAYGERLLREEVTSLEQVREIERLDAVFRVSPHGTPKIKRIKKEQKLYFWDWARCTSDAARLENMVALHLLERWIGLPKSKVSACSSATSSAPAPARRSTSCSCAPASRG